MWALIGTFLPLVAGCIGGPFLVFTAGRTRLDQSGISETDTSLIHAKWGRLQALGLGGNFDAALALYERPTRPSLAAMSVTRRFEKARAGELGLPLLPPDLLAQPISKFWISATHFSDVPGPDHEALVTATDGLTTLRFPMRRYATVSAEGIVSLTWDFAVGNVEIE